MKDFIYEIPTKVYFGDSHLPQFVTNISQYGKNILIVCGMGSIYRTGIFDEVESEFKAQNLNIFTLGGVESNPRVASVIEGANLCREHKIDFILAIGGGSVIDCAKGIALQAVYDGDS